MKKGYKLVKSLFGKYEEIPDDWDVKQIDSLGKIVTGSTPSTSIREFYDDGQFLWVTPPDLESVKYVTTTQTKLSKKGFEQTRKLPPKSVLVTCIGTVGRTGIGMQKMATNQQINAVIATNVDHEFLYYQLSYNHEKIKNMANQAVVPILNKTDFGTIKILIPASEKEQQKIASILSNVDSLINQTQKEIEQTQRLKKGLMQKLLTKGIGHTRFKKVKSLFGKYEEIPKEWNLKRLNDIGQIIGGGTPDSTINEYWNGEILWAVPTDITKLSSNFISETERKITEKGLTESSAKLLPIGTVLITTRATIGECAINTKPIATNQGFQNLICDDENDRHFMFYAIKFHRNKLLRLSYGTTFPEISKSEIKKVLIALPESRIEQQKIASILSNIDSQIQKQQEYKSKLETLKKGLMQKLLTGQIRVKM